MRSASIFTRSFKHYSIGSALDTFLGKIVWYLIVIFFIIGIILGPDALRFLTSWTY